MAHTDDSEIIRGAVWLRPTGDALERIQKVARQVHNSAGGGTPPQPHITLLSGMETTLADATLKLKRLAARIKPFSVQLGALESRDSYFRCLYAAVAANAQLAAAQRDAYEAFEMKPAPPFEPHVSLLYGNLDGATTRKLAVDAGSKLDIAFEVRAVHLVNASMGIPSSEWRTLAEHPVAGA